MWHGMTRASSISISDTKKSETMAKGESERVRARGVRSSKVGKSEYGQSSLCFSGLSKQIKGVAKVLTKIDKAIKGGIDSQPVEELCVWFSTRQRVIARPLGQHRPIRPSESCTSNGPQASLIVHSHSHHFHQYQLS